MVLTSQLPIILVVLSAISSINHGFPHSETYTSTVADVAEVSTNQETPTVNTAATPTAADSHVTDRGVHLTSHVFASDNTRQETPVGGDVADENAIAANNHTNHVFANEENGQRREVVDLTRSQEGAHDAAPSGFPWWSLMLVLVGTIVIVVAIAVPFYLYNRRLNHRHSVIINSKRASEVIVDSWIAASRSSIGPVSSSTPSQSGNDDDNDAGDDYRAAGGKQSLEFGSTSAREGGDEEHILGAVGGCDVP